MQPHLRLSRVCACTTDSFDIEKYIVKLEMSQTSTLWSIRYLCSCITVRKFSTLKVLLPPRLPSAWISSSRLCSNSDLDFNTSLNVDDNLLDHLCRGIQIDQPLVNPHLVHVPCLGTLTTRSLSSRHLNHDHVSLFFVSLSFFYNHREVLVMKERGKEFGEFF